MEATPRRRGGVGALGDHARRTELREDWHRVDALVFVEVKVEDDDAGSLAGRHADHGVGMPGPHLADRIRINAGVFEAMRCERLFVGTAWEDGPTWRGPFEGGIERSHWTFSRHCARASASGGRLAPARITFNRDESGRTRSRRS